MHSLKVPTGSTLAIILGGGRGTRLFPLTRDRSKPAVPLGGKYRLIDVPISNCINSGLRQIYILTQFMSASLNSHVSSAYRMDSFTDGFVGILAATQTDLGKEDWFQGTADAVRKCAITANIDRYERVIILSGDQLYKMDYTGILEAHENCGADITVGVLPVERDKVEGFGVMLTAADGRITDFVEKPRDPEIIKRYEVDAARLAKDKIDPAKKWFASMGIYVFETPVLQKILEDETVIDFGKDVIPSSIPVYKTCSHLFDGYWEDIGTIESFFHANIAMGSRNPPFDFYGGKARKVFTNRRHLAPARFMGTQTRESIFSDGVFIDEGTVIDRSVIGIRSTIGARTHIEESVIFGADYYERPGGVARPGIGPDVTIKRAILDKNVSVGAGVKIINAKGADHEDGECYYIRNGIVVIPKNAVVPDGMVI